MKKFKLALQAYYILLGAMIFLALAYKSLATDNLTVAIMVTAVSLLTMLTWLYALGLNSLNRQAGTAQAHRAMGMSGWIGTSTGLILILAMPFLKSPKALLGFAPVFLFVSMAAIVIGILSARRLTAAQPG